jgi:AcrR family transcriptional regulator
VIGDRAVIWAYILRRAADVTPNSGIAEFGGMPRQCLPAVVVSTHLRAILDMPQGPKAANHAGRLRTQRRGDRRRERLLEAAGELICARPLPEVSYAAICSRAGVPPSSAYHFYPDLDALFRALLESGRAGFDAALMKPMRASQIRSWHAVVEALVGRAASYNRTHPVAARLAIGGHTPPQLKRLDRDADRVRAGLALAALEGLFVMPRMRHKQQVAFVATEIVDAVFTTSMIEMGRITPAYVTLAKRAVVGFLGQYFGATLRRRRAD